MTYTNHWEQDGLYVDYGTHTSEAELLQSIDALSADPRFDHVHYIIGDWSRSAQAEFTSEYVEKLVAMIAVLAKSRPLICNAVVLPQHEDAQAMAAFYVHLAEVLPWKVAWFRTLEEARAWIAEELCSGA